MASIADNPVPGISLLFSRSPMTAFARQVAAEAGYGEHVGAVATGMTIMAMLARTDPQAVQSLLTAHIAAIGDDLDRSVTKQRVAHMLAEITHLLAEGA